MPKRPPKQKKGNCPEGGDHVARVGGKRKNGQIEHECEKCGMSWLRLADPKRTAP